MFLLGWAVVSGFLYGSVGFGWEPFFRLLDLVVVMAAMIRWTRWDAAERDFTLWRYFVPLLVICPGPIIVMPVYFVQSRGWSRGLLATFLGLAFLVLQAGLDLFATNVAIELFWDA